MNTSRSDQPTPEPRGSRELSRTLGDAFAEVPGDEDFEPQAELEALGLDAKDVALRMRAVADEARRDWEFQRVKDRLTGWVDQLMDEIGSWLIPATPASVFRGAEKQEEPNEDPRFDEAVALLGNGAFPAARERLVALTQQHPDRETYLWALAHACLGCGEIDAARDLLSRLSADGSEAAQDRLDELDRDLGLDSASA